MRRGRKIVIAPHIKMEFTVERISKYMKREPPVERIRSDIENPIL